MDDLLPAELLALVVSKIDAIDIYPASMVSRRWRALALADLGQRRRKKDRHRRHPNGYLAALAEAGRLAQLEWAVAAGWLWDGRVFACAAKGGHIDVIEWLHARECPWDWRAYQEADAAGHHAVALWLAANGCPTEPPAISSWGSVWRGVLLE
ncbi:F-box incomplete domain containing protein [Pandoravirus salinus]|uniref:F-box incomplete domain containing protein n=1 Tax=Pandoravirus salinus TaxID=1349410 RepID=S4VY17_9VIRU|nr:F-box incomplete domain [Pandoravirus salinus]AGO85263.2 F-box incomplete domain containing protein [Pandoravirus salinus]